MMENSISSGPFSFLGQYVSAKIKLDELFLSFVQAEGQEKLLNLVTEAAKYRSEEDREKMGLDRGILGSHPKSLLYKKSPKKRTQSEMSSNNQQQPNINKSIDEMSRLSLSSLSSNSGSPTSAESMYIANSPSHHLTAGITSPTTGTTSTTSTESLAIGGDDQMMAESPKDTVTTKDVSAESPVSSTMQPSSMRRKPNFDTIPIFYSPSSSSSSHLSSTSTSSTTSSSASSVVNKKVSSCLPHLPYSLYTQELEENKLSKKLTEIEAFFKPFPGGIPVEKFVHVTKRLCGIPSFFNLPLCRTINERYGDEGESGIPAPRTIVGRSAAAAAAALSATARTSSSSSTPAVVAPAGTAKIKLKTFLKFWSAEMEPFDKMERFFNILKKPEATYIVKDDFVPYLQELLHFHPGLDFLEQHEEFQRKYALTVITRIFYKVNTSRSGKISLREVRKSNLFTACMHVDEETDINKVLDYFSYEHFYVIYCKFFELDDDKDSKITVQDLLKYGEHALSEVIVERIFEVGHRVFTDNEIGHYGRSTSTALLEDQGAIGAAAASGTGGMSYPDFIFFMLSEEDKTTECALSYWFRCCDLDGDGYLSPEEMRYFYRQQIQRITSLGQESINFSDVLCQMLDMVAPQDTNKITLEDLLRPDKHMISGVLFDVLFNLHKFMRFESRDPFQEKIRREDIFHSDWDRYAHAEYNRLAQEEEEEEQQGGGSDGGGGQGGHGDEDDMEVDNNNNMMMMMQGGEAGHRHRGVDDEDDDDEDEHHVHQDKKLEGSWSLNDEEEESEEEEDALIGNRIANTTSSSRHRR